MSQTLSFNDFITSDTRVLLANSHFIFDQNLDYNFFKQFVKTFYNKKINDYLEYNKYKEYRHEINFLSNTYETLLPENIYCDYKEANDKNFINNLLSHFDNISLKNPKPQFFWYSFHDHITSVFINFKENFIVFYNSNEIIYENNVLNDIIIYVNSLKSFFKHDLTTFKITLLQSGKQTSDPFCFIYTNVFLIKLLMLNKEELNDVNNIKRIANSIQKEDVCNFFYNYYIMNYTKFEKIFNTVNKKNINVHNKADIENIKKIDIHLYNLIDVRGQLDLLSGLTCKGNLIKSKKTPLHVSNGKITICKKDNLIDVCFNSVYKIYHMKCNEIDHISEYSKCN